MNIFYNNNYRHDYYIYMEGFFWNFISVSHISLLYYSTACHMPSKCPSHEGRPLLHVDVHVLHVHDGLLEHLFWDLAKLNSNFPLQSSHVLIFAGWGCATLSFSVTSKERNNMACSQVSRGPSTWWQALHNVIKKHHRWETCTQSLFMRRRKICFKLHVVKNVETI